MKILSNKAFNKLNFEAYDLKKQLEVKTEFKQSMKNEYHILLNSKDQEIKKINYDLKMQAHKTNFAIENKPLYKIGETISGKTILKIRLEFRKQAFIEGMVVIGAGLFCDIFKGKPSKIKTLDVNKEINKIKKFEYVYEIKCSCGKIETLKETELEKLSKIEK